MSLQELQVSFDKKKAESFADSLGATLNKGAVCLMVSIGHRTGLFDSMEKSGPVTSIELAGLTGLNERYVREWLASMYMADFLEYDPDSGRYTLPPEHAAFLTRSAAPNNLAVQAQYLPILAAVEEDVVQCFRNGGGVGYEKYRDFHRVMEEESSQTVVHHLFDLILPLVPGVIEAMEKGIRVADMGCGRGQALIRMAERFPRSSFTGYDLSDEALDTARKRAGEMNLSNIEFIQMDLTELPNRVEPASYDLVVTFDAVHDQKKPLDLLRGINTALDDNGTYLMQDIRGHSEVHQNRDNPFAAFLYAISCMHCMTVSLAQGGDGLGTMWGREKAVELLNEAGFTHIDIRELEHDPMNDFYVIRK